jgi:3-oxoacyl-[acyl-carrier-protein] synthase-3
MLISEFKNIKISGMSVAVPPNQVPIDTYAETFGAKMVSEFIEMAGVKVVHRAEPEQTASDLGFEAAQMLINTREIDVNKIGSLIFVTQKPDQRVPSTAFLIHKRLGLSKECSCFDLNLACSGYVYGLQLIMSMLKHSALPLALLITGDTSARTISPNDRSMILLFGDSGTATLLERTNENIELYISVRTDGRRFKAIITPSGAYRNMDAPRERTQWGDRIVRSDYDTHMKGMDVFGFSITDVPKLMKELMDYLNTTPETYDCFALHQANLYIIKQIYRKLKIPVEKIPLSIDRFGNNSSNSIPLLLADHYGNGQNKQIRTMMCGFGAGLSWGCCDTLLNTGNILPILYTDKYYRE